MTEAENAGAAIVALEAAGDADRATGMAAYHKAPRRYLGVPVPAIEAMVQDWRAARDLPGRVALARALWDSDIHEARVAAAKLLTQARITEDAAVWDLFCDWAEGFDAWAIADHACAAGSRRVMADLSRLDRLDGWTAHPNMWTRRAALVTTLPLARLNHPKPAELAARERVLGWATGYVADRDWFIQKSVAWWLRDLSKHDADRARAWLADHGAGLKSFARKEAGRYLPAF
jgi:3-methyladenine DNA glycosylase AlkD